MIAAKRGRPVSTGSWSTPTIQYRVSAVQHMELQLEAKRQKVTVNEIAKRRAFPPTEKEHAAGVPYPWELGPETSE